MTSILPGFITEEDAFVPSSRHYRTLSVSVRGHEVVQLAFKIPIISDIIDKGVCLANCVGSISQCEDVQCLFDGANDCMGCV